MNGLRARLYLVPSAGNVNNFVLVCSPLQHSFDGPGAVDIALEALGFAETANLKRGQHDQAADWPAVSCSGSGMSCMPEVLRPWLKVIESTWLDGPLCPAIIRRQIRRRQILCRIWEWPAVGIRTCIPSVNHYVVSARCWRCFGRS